MRNKSVLSLGKRIAYILRHNPKSIKSEIDKNGWMNTDELLAGLDIDLETLEKIVELDNKKRYSFNDDKTKIRANQGHSIFIDLQLEPAEEVPIILYHGTKQHFKESIMKKGLVPLTRQHVHLSEDQDTAIDVADRRKGESIILIIDSKKMKEDGFSFYKSENDVWLTDHVDPKYIK